MAGTPGNAVRTPGSLRCLREMLPAASTRGISDTAQEQTSASGQYLRPLYRCGEDLKFGGTCLIASRPGSRAEQALQRVNAACFDLGKRNACVATDPGRAWLAGAISIVQPLAVLLEGVLPFPRGNLWGIEQHRQGGQSCSCSSQPTAPSMRSGAETRGGLGDALPTPDLSSEEEERAPPLPTQPPSKRFPAHGSRVDA